MKASVIVALSALSGFLFGYDLCVMVVALSMIGEDLDLSLVEKQSVISVVMFAAVLGSLLAGDSCDRFGRKRCILTTSFLFFSGGVVMALAPNVAILLLGRVLVGLAVGASGPCVSMYLSEIAEPHIRGKLVTVNELMLCIGCFSTVLVNQGFVSWTHGWRYMVALTALPALIQLIGVPFLPESPVWLQQNKYIELTSSTNVAGHRTEDPNSFTVLYHAIRSCSADRKRVCIALGLAIGQAFTGAGAVLYYSHNILHGTGIKDPLAAETGIAAVKLVGVALALGVVDRVGRRNLLLVGSIMMVICHVLMAGLFYGSSPDAFDTSKAPQELPEGTRIALIVTLHVFILFWNVSWAPMMWLVSSEVLPDRLRSAGMGLTLALFWLLCAVVNQTILSLFDSIGMSGTFGLYGSTTAGALVFVYLYVPETKGLDLADMDALFR